MSVPEGFYLFAGVAVRDLGTALEWYVRLLGGPPTMLPNDTEAVWDLADRRSVYLRQAPEHAGGSEVTLFFDDISDLDASVAAASERGIEPEKRETYGNGVRKVTYRDSDGNQIGFGGMPPGAG